MPGSASTSATTWRKRAERDGQPGTMIPRNSTPRQPRQAPSVAHRDHPRRPAGDGCLSSRRSSERGAAQSSWRAHYRRGRIWLGWGLSTTALRLTNAFDLCARLLVTGPGHCSTHFGLGEGHCDWVRQLFWSRSASALRIDPSAQARRAVCGRQVALGGRSLPDDQSQPHCRPTSRRAGRETPSGVSGLCRSRK